MSYEKVSITPLFDDNGNMAGRLSVENVNGGVLFKIELKKELE